MQVRVAIMGRNYDMAAALPDRLTLPEGCSLDTALARLAELVPDGKRLPETCLVAVSGTHLGTLGQHRDRPLSDGDELLVLSPVAGG